MDQVKTTRQDETIPADIGGTPVTLGVRRLRRSQQIACAQMAGGQQALIAAIQMMVFRAAVTSVTGGPRYKHIKHPEIGQLAPVDLYDDVDVDVVERVCRVAAPEIFEPAVVEEQAKNSAPPPPGSTAVSG